jgi:hypothetical protein
MNFYFSLFQLIETVEHLERDVQHLAGRALRISPRDARANRELLEQCESKMHEVKVLLNNKTHISKITLRKAALLFQILEVFYHRMLHLASAASNVGPDDENSVKTIWQLLSLAQRHYQTLAKTLYELTGIPVTLNLTGTQEVSAHDLPVILQKEGAYQQEALKLLEKAIEVFGEEQDLAEQLSQIRKDLLDIKKRMKHFSVGHGLEKADFPKISADKAESPKEKAPEKAESAAPLRS